jgi:hypothetical protein
MPGQQLIGQMPTEIFWIIHSKQSIRFRSSDNPRNRMGDFYSVRALPSPGSPGIAQVVVCRGWLPQGQPGLLLRHSAGYCRVTLMWKGASNCPTARKPPCVLDISVPTAGLAAGVTTQVSGSDPAGM